MYFIDSGSETLEGRSTRRHAPSHSLCHLDHRHFHPFRLAEDSTRTPRGHVG